MLIRVYVPITNLLRKKPKRVVPPWEVVWYFDDRGRVLYVQPTRDVDKLLEHHKRHSHWHDQVHKVVRQQYSTAREAKVTALRAWSVDRPVYSIWGTLPRTSTGRH